MIENAAVPMAFPIRICSVCSQEFELKPDKPGFANRCPACGNGENTKGATKSALAGQGDSELSAARRKAMRDLLYRKDG